MNYQKDIPELPLEPKVHKQYCWRCGEQVTGKAYEIMGELFCGNCISLCEVII